MHVLKESLCLASTCEEEKKLAFLQGAGKYFVGLTKDALLFMSGFIQAGPAWERCDNDVITTVT